jgi:poly(3-hydroxyalkanoate) synthetase
MANQWEQDDRQQQEYWQNLELEIGFDEHLEQAELPPGNWWENEQIGEQI